MTMIDTAKIELKVFAAGSNGAANGGELDIEGLIPVFHRWVRDQCLEETMIDVADYTHVPNGPGVLLVCHDANYSLDQGGGETGLLYSRRRETHPSLGNIESLDDRLASVFRRSLEACVLLEEEPSLAGTVHFSGDRFLLWVNDRLIGRDGEEELETASKRLLARLAPEAELSLVSATSEGGRLGHHLRLAGSPGIRSLLAEIGEPSGESE